MTEATLIGAVPADFEDTPPSFRAQRRRAAEILRRRGLPTRKDEAWRFTSVQGFAERAFTDASALPGSVQVAPAPDDGIARIVLANGIPRLDDVPQARGLLVRNLRDAMRDDASRFEALLGTAPEDAPFAALNDALFRDGLFLEVTGETALLHVVHVRTPSDRATVAYPRIVVEARARSRFVLIETHRSTEAEAQDLRAPVVDVILGPESTVEHVRVYDDPGTTLARVAVRQAARSRYVSRVFTTAGSLAREDLVVAIEGPGASTELEGVYVCGGDEHCDHHVRVEHRAGGSTSRMRYRGVVGGRATSVFDGTSIVLRDAQKTEAHQENRNLLLGSEATVHTKPHLRIDADDVACSHGATVGTLDADQLFYLRARGVPEAEAEALLVQAFLRAIIDGIDSPSVRSSVTQAVFRKLPHGIVPEGALE